MTAYVATSANPVFNVTLAAGDTLVVSSGGFVSGVTLLSSASGTVLNGGSAASVTDGGQFAVSAGGFATNLTVTTSGNAGIAAGADGNGIVVNGGSLFVQGTAETVIVKHTGNVSISGGTVSGLTVAALGLAYVFSGSVLNATVSAHGALAEVGSGGIVSGLYVSSGGSFTAKDGIVSALTLASGGDDTQYGATAYNTEILSGAVETIDAGVSISSLIDSGGEQDIEGGSVSGATVLSGGQQVLLGAGSAFGTLVQDGGVLNLAAGVASGATILSGGVISVGQGDASTSASAVSTTIYAAGAAEVFEGGTVLGTVLSAGGVLALIGGGEQQTNNLGGVIASAGVLADGQATGFTYLGLTTRDDTVGNGVSEMVFGVGGLATNTAVGSGALLVVESGGVASRTLADGGIVILASGGLESGALVGPGGRLLVAGGASYGADVMRGGAAGIIDSGTLSGTILESGGLGGAFGGEMDGTDVRSGGALAVLGGTTSNTLVESGGAEGLETSGIFFGSSPTSAVNTVLQAGGYLVPQSGTLVTGTSGPGAVITTGVFVVYTNSGSVFYPTSATDLLLSGGSLAAVQAGGVLHGGIVEGGYPLITSGAAVFPIPSAVLDGPGGLVTSVTFTDSTTLDVAGSAVSITLTGSAAETVEAGGIDSGIVLSAGTMQQVNSGGMAFATVISSGGQQVIETSVGVGGSDGETIVGSVLLPGGQLFFAGLSYIPGVTSATFDTSTNTLSITDPGVVDRLTLAGNYSNVSFDVLSGGLSQDYGVSVTAQLACYGPDTLIATDRGEVPVQALAIGDTVVTAAGQHRPVRWIGRRSYVGRFLAANPGVQPICFRAGSLDHGLPRRDLLVSPEHAMLLDGVLVPARCLVNGRTIMQERTLKRVDYFHVELDTHDVLLAEGAPSESYLDDDSRGMFHNAAEFAAMYPGAADPGRFCAPKVTDGYELEAIRQRLTFIAGTIEEAA